MLGDQVAEEDVYPARFRVSGFPTADQLSAITAESLTMQFGMQRALDAWTAVPESRLVLQMGNDNYDYTSTHLKSPANQYNGINVILFDDPYDNINDGTVDSRIVAVPAGASRLDSPLPDFEITKKVERS